ncbi:hypothetical protein TrVE_jg14464 [Triparma verrucosa]|uniref:Fe2OG dioxygenase domain-containing protein n=1 Tax=Triparma verrucosa TaxID=1606542 RepID=A0A9W7C539_9STRA|nr:hypothetical protein TrVE_jg14464 [Triparma verrucosa]
MEKRAENHLRVFGEILNLCVLFSSFIPFYTSRFIIILAIGASTTLTPPTAAHDDNGVLSDPADIWVCSECSQECECFDAACVCCDAPRPGAPPPPVAAPRRLDSEAFHYSRVLSPGVCNQLIRMSRERVLSMDLDTVDDAPVYQVDLVQNGWVSDADMWSVVGPAFDLRLKPLLAKLPWLQDTAFTLDHVFLKRYRPEERTHLGIHVDSSFCTYNVLVSDPLAFKGGEIYIFTPAQTQKHFERHEAMSTKQKDDWVGGHAQLPTVEGYGQGDTLAFTGDRHLHGTLPVTWGERVVLTFFFERLGDDAKGQSCSSCGEWRERYDYSKKQLRRGGDADCRRCTGEIVAAVLCSTCGLGSAEHHGGCCAGTDIGTCSSSHKGVDRPNARPWGTVSFAKSRSVEFGEG